jgi:hypothetical protein
MTTRPFYITLYGTPILKYSDGNLYDLRIQLYYPPKVGLYNENGIATVHAYSFIVGDPNTNRSESSSGFVNISRVSRGFVSGEFEFHMVSNGNKQPKEFEIAKGKFKSLLRDNSDRRFYIQY